MAKTEKLITIRAYTNLDYDQVEALFIRVDRELAPSGMRRLFEEYISTVINAELKRLEEVFSEAKRSAF